MDTTHSLRKIAEEALDNLPPLTDMWNGIQVVLRYVETMRYCKTRQTWMIWNGTRWQDDAGGILSFQNVVETLAFLNTAPRSDYSSSELRRWVKQSLSANGIKNTLSCAKAFASIEENEFDTHNDLLNVQNGTLDLKTGTLLEHTSDDMITKLANVTYDEHATCPQWERFIHWASHNREDWARYLQRVLGYSITGDVSEHKMFFAHGAGDNGKSVLFNTIQRILGDYAQSLPASVLYDMEKKANVPTPSTARLKGARLVLCSEGEEGQRLSESMAKTLASGDRIAARHPFGQEFEFEPTHTLIWPTNHLPQIKGEDRGIWRRAKIIPFDNRIREKEKDFTLESHLLEEASGILNWLIAGCLAWHAEGLGECEAVDGALQDYKASMNTLQLFIDECCITGSEELCGVQALFTTYKRWCEDGGIPYRTKIHFGKALKEKLRLAEAKPIKGERTWQGIGLARVTKTVRQHNAPLSFLDTMRDLNLRNTGSC